MSRFRFLRLRHLRHRSSDETDAADRKEIERLRAEYTGSGYARNVGQECGIVPGRYGEPRR